MEDRRAQLDSLIRDLGQLTELLAFDPACQWRHHFLTCLRSAKELSHAAPTQQDLSSLSGSVMSVFGGMGSFNDYAPFRGGRVIAGMESLEDISGRVYESALSLRVIES